MKKKSHNNAPNILGTSMKCGRPTRAHSRSGAQFLEACRSCITILTFLIYVHSMFHLHIPSLGCLGFEESRRCK